MEYIRALMATEREWQTDRVKWLQLPFNSDGQRHDINRWLLKYEWASVEWVNEGGRVVLKWRSGHHYAVFG